MIKTCPKCAEKIDVAKELTGTQAECPICGSVIDIPKPKPRKKAVNNIDTAPPVATVKKSRAVKPAKKVNPDAEPWDFFDEINLFSTKSIIGMVVIIAGPLFLFGGIESALPALIVGGVVLLGHYIAFK